ncbi:hypothetical protein ACQP3C_30290, partial [Escherichia coli]
CVKKTITQNKTKPPKQLPPTKEIKTKNLTHIAIYNKTSQHKKLCVAKRWWCTQEAEAGGSLEFKASLVYRVSSGHLGPYR